MAKKKKIEIVIEPTFGQIYDIIALIMSKPVTFVAWGKYIFSRAKDETPGWKQSLLGGEFLPVKEPCFFGSDDSFFGVESLQNTEEVKIYCNTKKNQVDEIMTLFYIRLKKENLKN